MIILNFSHPLTSDQLAQAEKLIGGQSGRLINVPCQVDQQQPLAPQVAALADSCGLSPQDWQTAPLLVNLPGLSAAAVVLMAELHGRCGYFPPCLRIIRAGGTPPRFEVAEVMDLQAVRDDARTRR